MSQTLQAFLFSLALLGQWPCYCFSQELSPNTNKQTAIELTVAQCEWQWEASQVGPLLEGFWPRGKYGFKVESLSRGMNCKISVTNEGDDIFSWKGNYTSVFRIAEDRLYFADWSPIGTGGEIVAVDLLSGKELWRKQLKALGPISHSGYANSIRLDLKRGGIWIWGKESLGKYVEVKHPESGKTIAHKVFSAP